MLFRIRRFGVVRTANLAAALYFLVTLIFFVPFIVIGFLAMPAGSPSGAMPGTAGFDFRPLGIALAIIVPLLYALFGWIATALACLMYNLVARFTGGIEFELTQPAPPAGSAPAASGVEAAAW